MRALGVDEIDLSDLEFWKRPIEEREGAFATLREERPVSFHEEPELEIIPKGAGPHYCLGAHLARREIRIMLREILTRLPDLEITGEPDRLVSNFIHGIKHMPCTFTPSPTR